ncbi:IclR family transcriptional regulator [Parafrankia colletiae]|uniref:IclR family transcriptional regulator n=1 Tax=Parafrankia colletiae TaxID=573497 RepID=A0A1S1RG41_9ACTN|nr:MULTISPECIES: IclR family transcriptional regulator [Frankiaceae]MCK9905154.1 IclR family transcriptional regulator [Frankia sp. Cpl3]MCL9763025.1 IclR family transcriptional regulator [Frankia sp. AiPa1]OHV45713.1 IclR family transcriptional regulator [Parafrankia colletiae]
MAGNTGTPGATVTGRIMSILSGFDEHHPRLSLTEIARRADLPPATVHRLVAELVRHGALARADGDYVIGRRLWDLGLLAPIQSTLRETASPFLHDIHAATRATVHLAVRDGHQVLYVERMSGLASVPVVSSVGSTLPMHATGVGKVLLAHAPEDVRHRVLSSLTRVTPYTITQPGLLLKQLERVRHEGWATTVEEMSLGACSVAVPVRREDEVVAAIGIVAATIRRDRGRLTAVLQVAAQGIARQLGGIPPR